MDSITKIVGCIVLGSICVMASIALFAPVKEQTAICEYYGYKYVTPKSVSISQAGFTECIKTSIQKNNGTRAYLSDQEYVNNSVVIEQHAWFSYDATPVPAMNNVERWLNHK